MSDNNDKSTDTAETEKEQLEAAEETKPTAMVPKTTRAKKNTASEPPVETSNIKITEASESRYDVDALAAEMGTDAAVFAAVKVMHGWGKGKRVTKTEYKAAEKRFLYGACDGSEINC